MGYIIAEPFLKEESDGTFSGFEVDLLQALVDLGTQDNLTVSFSLTNQSLLPQDALDTIAPNCTASCDIWDMIVDDYFTTPERTVRIRYTPDWQRTNIGLARLPSGTANFFSDLVEANLTTCIAAGSYVLDVVKDRYPSLPIYLCEGSSKCLDELVAGLCAAIADDPSLLRYTATQTGRIVVTHEAIATQYTAWPLRLGLDANIYHTMDYLMAGAIGTGALDAISVKYFGAPQAQVCVVSSGTKAPAAAPSGGGAPSGGAPTRGTPTGATLTSKGGPKELSMVVAAFGAVVFLLG